MADLFTPYGIFHEQFQEISDIISLLPTNIKKLLKIAQNGDFFQYFQDNIFKSKLSELILPEPNPDSKNKYILCQWKTLAFLSLSEILRTVTFLGTYELNSTKIIEFKSDSEIIYEYDNNTHLFVSNKLLHGQLGYLFQLEIFFIKNPEKSKFKTRTYTERCADNSDLTICEFLGETMDIYIPRIYKIIISENNIQKYILDPTGIYNIYNNQNLNIPGYNKYISQLNKSLFIISGESKFDINKLSEEYYQLYIKFINLINNPDIIKKKPIIFKFLEKLDYQGIIQKYKKLFLIIMEIEKLNSDLSQV